MLMVVDAFYEALISVFYLNHLWQDEGALFLVKEAKK